MKRHGYAFLLAVVSIPCFCGFIAAVPTEGRTSLTGRRSVSKSSTSASHSLMLCGNVYTWTDENGVIHFSDDLTRVPSSRHQEIESISLPDHPSGPAPSSQPPPAPIAEGGAAAGPRSPPQAPIEREAEEAARSPYEKCMERVATKKEELNKRLSEDLGMLDGLGKNLEKKKVEDGGEERTQRPQRDKPVRTRDKREYRRTRTELRDNVTKTQEQLTNEVGMMEEECRRLR